MPKRGGKKNRRHNPTNRIVSSCESHKRGHRAAETEQQRNDRHKLVNAFKSAASASLFKTVLPNKFTTEDNQNTLKSKMKKDAAPCAYFFSVLISMNFSEKLLMITFGLRRSLASGGLWPPAVLVMSRKSKLCQGNQSYVKEIIVMSRKS